MPAASPLKSEAGRADRDAARMGLPLGGGFGADGAGGVLGRGAVAARSPPRRRRPDVSSTNTWRRGRPPQQRIEALAAVSDKLAADFGKWQTPWGDINRFQRLTADIVHPFDDAGPSIPVPFTSARWGSLASFGARAYKGSKKMYGTTGNSFLAIVEFGDKVSARAVTAGGAKRRSEVATLQRPGDALRARQPARGVFLSRAAKGTPSASIIQAINCPGVDLSTHTRSRVYSSAFSG